MVDEHAGAVSRILIVEGTSGVGKSTLIDALVRRQVGEPKPRTLLRLTQAHTYAPLAPGEDRGDLSVEQNLAHLEQIVGMLEWYARMGKFFAVVDTLHLTHCYRPGVVRWQQVEPVDRRLAALGANMIVVHGSPATLWDRGIWPRREAQFITGYARKWGDSLERIHAHFVAEQAAMRELARRTRLELREICVDGEVSTYVDEAYAFWMRG